MLGLVALVWIVGITFNKIVGGTVEVVAKKNASDNLDEMFRNNEITYEQYIAGLESLWGGTNWGKIILWAGALGAIGVGGYYITKGVIIPKLKR